MAILFICSGLLLVPIGGQPAGGYIAVPIQHGVHYLWNHVRKHQKKLKHREPIPGADSGAQAPGSEVAR